MIHKEIVDFVSQNATVEIVRNSAKWLQLLKTKKTNVNLIIEFCSKFKGINIVDTIDYVHVLSDDQGLKQVCHNLF